MIDCHIPTSVGISDFDYYILLCTIKTIIIYLYSTIMIIDYLSRLLRLLQRSHISEFLQAPNHHSARRPVLLTIKGGGFASGSLVDVVPWDVGGEVLVDVDGEKFMGKPSVNGYVYIYICVYIYIYNGMAKSSMVCTIMGSISHTDLIGGWASHLQKMGESQNGGVP